MPALGSGYGNRPAHVKRRKPKPWTPTPTQLRSARAQGRTYASQGRAIKRQAATQRVVGPGSVTHSPARLRQIKRDRRRRAREKRVRDALKAERALLSLERSTAPLARRQRREATVRRALATERYYSTFTPKGKVLGAELGLRGVDANRYLSPGAAAKRLSTAPGRGPAGGYQATRRELARIIGSEGVEAAKAHQLQRKAAHLAPIVNVLEQLQRPAYASAGASRAALRGENVLRGAARGALLKDRYLYSDVLKEAGVENKVIRGIAGFGLDVALDPSTYVTLGTAKVATKATAGLVERSAKEAAEEAARKLALRVRAGELSARRARQQVKAAGREAGKQTLKRELSKGAHKGRGVEVRFAGKRLPGVTRASAAVGQAQRRGIEAVTPARVKRAVKRRALPTRDIAATVNPTVRPPTLTSEQFARTREIGRRERGEAAHIERRAAGRAVVMQKLTRPSEWKQIRDAIEAGDIERLRGIAEPIKVPKLMAANKRARRLARDPDRLYRFAGGLVDDWTAMRKELVDLGVPIGYVGHKPPVQIPEVTADVTAARRELQQARRARQRAEIEQVERMPTHSPDAITATQRTHARSKAQAARTRYKQARDDFVRAKHEAAEIQREFIRRTEDPQFTIKSWHPQRRALAERAVELGADARAARRQMNAAQADLKHWATIARRPGTRTAPGEAGRHQIGELAATQRLREVKTQAGRQRKARRVAERRAEVQAREAKGYVPRVSKEAVRSRGRVAEIEDLEDLLKTEVRYGGKGAGPTQERKVVEPLAALEQTRPEYVERLEESLPLIAQSYGGAMGRRIARARTERALRDEGTPATIGTKPAEGERIYHYDEGELRELDPTRDADEIRAVATGLEPR
jgi:hypothetical protein